MSRRLSEDTDGDLLLRLLEEVDGADRLTQRSLAESLGIALGLTNTYLKRCVRKGWIRIRRVQPNRYRYFLTPTGFSEKARLTARYLAGSLKYITTLRQQLDRFYDRCEILGQRRVAIVGEGELAELAVLCASARAVEVTGVVDPAHLADGSEAGQGTEALAAAEAVIVVDLAASTALLNQLGAWFNANDIYRPALLTGENGSEDNS